MCFGIGMVGYQSHARLMHRLVLLPFEHCFCRRTGQTRNVLRACVALGPSGVVAFNDESPRCVSGLSARFCNPVQVGWGGTSYYLF